VPDYNPYAAFIRPAPGCSFTDKLPKNAFSHGVLSLLGITGYLSPSLPFRYLTIIDMIIIKKLRIVN